MLISVVLGVMTMVLGFFVHDIYGILLLPTTSNSNPTYGLLLLSNLPGYWSLFKLAVYL